MRYSNTFDLSYLSKNGQESDKDVLKWIGHVLRKEHQDITILKYAPRVFGTPSGKIHGVPPWKINGVCYFLIYARQLVFVIYLQKIVYFTVL